MTRLACVCRGFECILVEEACIDKTPERQAHVFALYKDYLYQTVSIDDLVPRDADSKDQK